MRITLVTALGAATLIACASAAPAAAQSPPSLSDPWTARGNEPNWSLTLEGGTMTFRPMDGATVKAPRPTPILRRGAWEYRAAEQGLRVSIRPRVCRDTMTGMPSPMSVRVRAGGKTFAGCGGAPSELLAGEWRVSTIGGKAVPKGIAVSLAFDTATGQVSGSSGCNRYFGGFALTGEGLSFKPNMAGSMMACEGPATRTEEAFKAALPTVQRFDIGADGSLRLLAGDRTVVKAKR